MAETIDELKIEVEAEAKDAATTIDNLSKELKSLKTSLDGIDVTKLKNLGTTFEKLGNINLSNSSKELRSLDKELDSVTQSVSKDLSENLINQFNITDQRIKKSVDSMSKKFVELNKSVIFDQSKESIDKLGDAYAKLEDKVSQNAQGLVDDELKDFYEYWKAAKPIYVSDKVINDFNQDNWKGLLKEFPGKFTTDLMKMQNSVNSIYTELADSYQGLFPEDIINESEQFQKIVDVLREYKQELSDTTTVAQGFENVQDAIDSTIGSAMNDLSKGYGGILGTGISAKEQSDAYNQVASQPGSGFSQSTELISELAAALKKLPSENNIGNITDQLQGLTGAVEGMGDYTDAASKIQSLSGAIDSLTQTNATKIESLTESIKQLQGMQESLNGSESNGQSAFGKFWQNIEDISNDADNADELLAKMIGDMTGFNKEFDDIPDESMKQAISEVDDLDESIMSIAANSSKAGSAFKDMVKNSEEGTTSEISTNYVGAMDSDSVKQSFSEISDKARKELSKIPGFFEEIGESARSLASGALKLVGSAFKDIGKAASSVAKGAGNVTKSFAKMVVGASPLGKLPDTFKKVSNATDTLNSKITRTVHLFTMMAMRSAFRAVMAELGTAFEHLAQKCDDVNTRYSALMSSMNQLAHSITALAQPLLNIFGPALEYVISLLNTAVNYMNQFLSAITGKTYTASKYVPSDYAASLEDAADAADDAADSQSRLNKQLQGFNELNNLTTTEPSTSLGSTGLNDLTDELEDCYETLDIEQDILDFVDKIKEAWANADFTEIGNILGEKLKNALDSIPWDEIQYYAWKIAHSLATLINGFIETEGLGETIGKTIGEAINTALIFADTFLTTLHWDSLGKFLADIMNGAVNTVDWELLGKTLGDAVSAWLMTIYNTLDNFDWNKLGKKLASCINSFVDVVNVALTSYDWKALGKKMISGLNTMIDSIDWGSLGLLLSNAVNALFGYIDGVISNFNFASFGKHLAEALSSAIKNTDFKTIGHAIGSLVQGAINFFANLVSGLTFEDFITAITDLFNGIFSGLDLNIDGSKIIQTIENTVKSIYKAITGMNGIELVLGAILAFSGVSRPLGIGLIATGAMGIASKAAENWGEIGNKIQQVITAIEKVVGIAFIAIGAVLLFTGNIPLGLGLLVTGFLNVRAGIDADWDSATNKVAGVLSVLNDIVSVAFLAIGAVLLFTGAGTGIGLGLLALGAVKMAESVTENLNIIPDKIQKVIDIITGIVEAAVIVIGVILLFTGGFSPLGLGLIAAGAVGLGERVAENWDYLSDKLSGVFRVLEGIVGGAALVLGVILLFTGAGIPLGLGLIAAGAASLGQAINPDWGSIFSDIGETLSGLKKQFTDWVSDMKEAAKEKIDMAIGLIKSGWSTLKGWVTDAKDTVVDCAVSLKKKASDWAADAWETIQSCGQSLATTVETKLKEGKEWAANAWEVIQAKGQTFATTVQTKLEQAKSWASNAWEVIQTKGQSFVATVQTKLEQGKEWAEDALQVIKAGGQSFVASVQTKLEQGKEWAEDALQVIKAGGQSFVTTVQTKLEQAKEWGEDALEVIKAGGQSFTSTVKTVVQKAGTWIDDAFEAIHSAGGTFTTTVKTAVQKAQSWVEDAVTAIKSIGQKGETEVKTKVTKDNSSDDTAVNAIKSDGKTLATTVTTKLEDAKNSASNAVTAIANAGKTIVTTVEEKLTKGSWSDDAWSALQSGANAVKNTTETGVKLVKSGWETITGWFKDKFGGLFGGSSDDESITVKIKLDKQNSDKVEDILADTQTVKIKLSDQSDKLTKVLDSEFTTKVKISKNSEKLSSILDSTFTTTVKLSDKSQKLSSILDSEFTTSVKLKKSGWDSFKDWIGGTDVNAKVSLTPTAASLWKTLKSDWSEAAGTVEFSADVKDESSTWWKNTQKYWKDKVGTADSFKTNVENEADTWWKNTKTYWSKKVGSVDSFKTAVENEADTWWKNTKSYWKAKVGSVDNFKTAVENEADTWWKNTKSYWSKKVGSVENFSTDVENESDTWWKNTKKYWKDKVGSVDNFKTAVENEADTWWKNTKTYWSKKVGTVDKFKTDVKDEGSTWWSNTKKYWEKVVGTVSSFKTNVKDDSKTWWSDVKSYWESTTSSKYVEANVRGKLDSASNWWTDLVEKIQKKIGTVYASVKAQVDNSSDWASNLNNSIKNNIGTVYAKVRGQIDYSTNWAQSVNNSIKNAVGTVTVSVRGTTSRAKGGVLENGSWSDIPQYAGGTVNAGSLFVAGEAGAELVGHIGNRTEVLNESQLAAVMESSVLAGVASLADYLNGIYKHMTVCANGIIGAIAVNYDTPQIMPETNNCYGNEYSTYMDQYGRDMNTVIDLLGQIADNTEGEDELRSDPNGLFTIMRRKNSEYRNATGKSAFA